MTDAEYEDRLFETAKIKDWRLREIEIQKIEQERKQSHDALARHLSNPTNGENNYG